ncbi:UNVERIFIED_CONTAM: hypothetical protein K2H54_047588 [Gekko kuhli]
MREFQVFVVEARQPQHTYLLRRLRKQGSQLRDGGKQHATRLNSTGSSEACHSRRVTQTRGHGEGDDDGRARLITLWFPRYHQRARLPLIITCLYEVQDTHC